MYIEERGWANAQILLTNCKYIEEFEFFNIFATGQRYIQNCKVITFEKLQITRSTSIEASVFNLPIQIVICHSILSYNCNNGFPPV